MTEPQLLGKCLSRLLESFLLPVGLSPPVSASAECKRPNHANVLSPIVDQLTCQRDGEAWAPWAKAALKFWAFGRNHLRLLTRLQT